MADLLARWLNEEVGLSKQISNFEDDFASGYLFGELLYKFNQQSDFEQFSTKNATSHYVMNFEKLEPTLRALKINFNSKTVEQILKQERGVALRVLYQIKMVLEKVYPPADISIVAKTGKFGDNQPAQKITQPKPKYDEVTHEFFKQRMAKLNRAQKEIDLEIHLKGFEDEKNKQADQASKLDKYDREEEMRQKQDMRRIQINKLQRNAGFMEEWLQKGVDEWKVNMTKKKEREATQLKFDYTQAEKFNKNVTFKLEQAQSEVYDGIQDFEAKLKAMGKTTKVSSEQADRAISMSLSGTGFQTTQTKNFDTKMATVKGNFTLTSTGLKQRTKVTYTEETNKQREKRRRRLITTQETLYNELNQATRQTNIFEIMKIQSKQEKELDYEAWRTTQCKTIIQENRKLREKQYEKRRQLDVEAAEIKEEKLIQEMQAASQRSVGEMVKRTDELKEYEKQQQLKTRTELCAKLMDKIFDIADEAYNHMQETDSKVWDQRNWHDWLDLFKNDKTISNTLTSLTSANSTDYTEQSNQKLDETDLTDYVKNLGQWPTTLVTNNKLDLNAVVNPPAETVAAPGGKAPPKKVAAVVETNFEPDDLVVKDSAENNFFLGDVIDQLIQLNFEQRPKLKHPQIPNWLSLKICLVGYPFSGTNTQAKLLKEKYGLDLFKMDELIQEAIDCSEEPVQMDGIEEEAVEENTKDSDFADLSEDEVHSPNPLQELRQLGILIRQALLEGKEVSDELYVRVFVNKLRCKYNYKSPKQKRQEIKSEANRVVRINSRVQEILIELAKEDLKPSLVKRLQNEKDELERELHQIKELDNNFGWVLIDFPQSYAQAKLLEQALSGYRPDEELEPIQRESQMVDASLLTQPNPKPVPPKTLIPSGVDAVYWFDCPAQECYRRADGRRFDYLYPDKIYHVEDKLPPINEAPLCEMLQPLSDDNNMVNTLADKIIAFDQTTNSLKRWLQNFGDAQFNRNLMHLIDANGSIEFVQNQIIEHLTAVLQQKTEKRNAERDQLSSKIAHKLAEAKILAENQEAAKILQQESQSQGSLSAHSHITPQKSNPATGRPKPIDKKEGKDKKADPKDAKKNNESSIDALPKSSTPVPPSVVFKRNNLDNDFKPVLMKLWQGLSMKYRKQMKVVFRNVRVMREKGFKTFVSIQNNFLTFVHRLDNKQDILDTFINNFNQFSDDFPDLREDDATKEELHQRCDVLSDELWEIVEERKDQNIEERKKIMESGEAEAVQEFLTLSAQQLMQAELDKFKVSIQIIHDYYHAVEEKNTPEITGSNTLELAFEESDLPPIESVLEGADKTSVDSYNFPRLEKLLAMALKHQIVPDVTQQAAGGAGADKKGAKAPPKKEAVVVEQPKEESIYVKEMREAVKVEKSILRFRLVQIRNWAYQRMKEQRATALNMYKKLDDWIFAAHKTEMDAIDEMCIVIKRAIEQEAKIQHELRIKFMDLTVDEKTLNFIVPPPPKLEALEELHDDRFSIAQLKTFLIEMECLTQSIGDNIQVVELASILFTKCNNSKHFGGAETSFPPAWNKLNLPSIIGILRNLDTANTGFVNWRLFFTYLILLKSHIVHDFKYNYIPNENGFAYEKDFCEAEFWFEETEQSKDRDYSHAFDRVKMIKELLFQVNKTTVEGGKTVINLGEFSRKVCLPAKKGCYQDLLFAKL